MFHSEDDIHDNIIFSIIIVSPLILIGLAILYALKRCLSVCREPPLQTPERVNSTPLDNHPPTSNHPNSHSSIQTPYYGPQHSFCTGRCQRDLHLEDVSGALHNVARAIAMSAQNMFLDSVTESMYALSPMHSVLRRKSFTDRRLFTERRTAVYF